MTSQDALVGRVLREVANCAWPNESERPFATFADRLAQRASSLSPAGVKHSVDCASMQTRLTLNKPPCDCGASSSAPVEQSAGVGVGGAAAGRHAQLMSFYAVTSLDDLIGAMEGHIKRLQDKSPQTVLPSMAPRVREG